MRRFPDNAALVNDVFTAGRSTEMAMLERDMPQALQAGVLDSRNPGAEEIAGYQIRASWGVAGWASSFAPGKWRWDALWP